MLNDGVIWRLVVLVKNFCLLDFFLWRIVFFVGFVLVLEFVGMFNGIRLKRFMLVLLFGLRSICVGVV